MGPTGLAPAPVLLTPDPVWSLDLSVLLQVPRQTWCFFPRAPGSGRNPRADAPSTPRAHWPLTMALVTESSTALPSGDKVACPLLPSLGRRLHFALGSELGPLLPSVAGALPGHGLVSKAKVGASSTLPAGPGPAPQRCLSGRARAG